MGLDSSGGAGRSKPPCADPIAGAADRLVAARKSVHRVLEQSRDAALSIDKSSERLRGMGDRLPALESAMRPLHAQSLRVKELSARLDRAVAPAEAVLRTFDMVRGLERTIRGDPRPDMPLYLASLEQLDEAMRFLSRHCLQAVDGIAEAKDFLARSDAADKYRMHRLTERLASVKRDVATASSAAVSPSGDGGNGWDMGLVSVGLSRLDAAFKKLLQETSAPMGLPQAIPRREDEGDPSSSAAAMAPVSPALPPVVISKLQIIVEKLNFHKWVDNVLESYREIRVATIRNSLQSLRPDYLRCTTVHELDRLDWADLEGQIEAWTQHIEVACTILFRSERKLCSRVFEQLEKEKWIRCWGKIAMAGFAPFLSFGEGVVGSQTAPEKLFKLLDMYEAVESLLPSVFEIFEGPDAGCGEVRVRCRELPKRIANRASETVWELCRFVEDGRGDAPADGGRSRLCNYVVNYVKYLVSEFYGPIMSKIVRTDKSWQERAASRRTSSDNDRQDNRNEDKWLSLVVTSVIQSLEKHVIKQSRTYKDSALASLFLLNNFYYISTRAKDSEIGPLLGENWRKETRGKVQKHTLEYQREAWSKPLSCLTRDGLSLSSSGGKGAVRELARQRIKNFTTFFEENCQKHSRWVVPEKDLRDGICVAVTQAVVSAYRNYVQTYWGILEQGGSISKYVKFSPEEVEEKLGNLFMVHELSRSRNGSSNHSHPDATLHPSFS